MANRRTVDIWVDDQHRDQRNRTACASRPRTAPPLKAALLSHFPCFADSVLTIQSGANVSPSDTEIAGPVIVHSGRTAERTRLCLLPFHTFHPTEYSSVHPFNALTLQFLEYTGAGALRPRHVYRCDTWPRRGTFTLVNHRHRIQPPRLSAQSHPRETRPAGAIHCQSPRQPRYVCLRASVSYLKRHFPCFSCPSLSRLCRHDKPLLTAYMRQIFFFLLSSRPRNRVSLPRQSMRLSTISMLRHRTTMRCCRKSSRSGRRKLSGGERHWRRPAQTILRSASSFA